MPPDFADFINEGVEIADDTSGVSADTLTVRQLLAKLSACEMDSTVHFIDISDEIAPVLQFEHIKRMVSSCVDVQVLNPPDWAVAHPAFVIVIDSEQ